jgi:hypothetical protein
MSIAPSILAAAGFFSDHLSLIVALGIVVVGLLVFGLKDLLRFSPARVGAISGVSFSESIRKRVLWVTPLAFLAVVIVSQFQKPVDELDAIRQTTKFCLFATGMLVTLTAIILACTNLPKEIDNRVIFTIVTKPTTRLEIVLGKVLGFAYVSASILIIMGLFTFGYLHLRSWAMQREIRDRLATGSADVALKPTLEHYVTAGLLNAKEFHQVSGLDFYSRRPATNDDRAFRWSSSAAEQSIAVPFEIPVGNLPATDEEAKQILPLRLVAELAARSTSGETAIEDPSAAPLPATRPATAPATLPTTQSVRIPYLPGKAPQGGTDGVAVGPQTPAVILEIQDRDFFTLVAPQGINGGKSMELIPNQIQILSVDLPATVMPAIRNMSIDGKTVRFHIVLRGTVAGFEYGVRPGGVRLGNAGRTTEEMFAEEYKAVPASRDGVPLVFRGRPGTHGQQLRGDKPGVAPVAIYRFRNQNVAATGTVPVEIRSFIERSGVDDDDEMLTDLQVRVVNRSSDVTSEPVVLHPENGRTAYANLPASAMAGGNFDLEFKVTSPGHWIALTNLNVGLVSADRSFGLNLFRSLLILWLLSVLVVAIAVFCSTFLSWPIAVVLTVVVLLGRWGVIQLGDALQPGIGRQVVTDVGLRGAAESQVVSNSVESLVWGLRAFSSVLPDINRFAVTADIERGIWIPSGAIFDALIVLLVFGLPLIVLSYLIFRSKEVAP